MSATTWFDALARYPRRARALLRGAPRRSFLGLDIGTKRLRLVELVRADGGPRVRRLAEATLDTGQDLTGAVMQVLQRTGIEARRVATAVPDGDVIAKRFVMPLPAHGDFEAAILEQAASCIPESLDQVHLDYQVLGTIEEGRKIEVLLVAARREIVRSRVASLRAAGLRPLVVDIDSFALANAFEASYELPPHSTALLLHLGEQRATMNLLQATRSLISLDVPLPPVPAGGVVDDEWRSTVVDEIHHALSFYWSPVNGDPRSNVFLSGAAANDRDLARLLCERLQMRVDVLDPFTRLALDPSLDDAATRAAAPTYALAVGLALRALAES